MSAGTAYEARVDDGAIQQSFRGGPSDASIEAVSPSSRPSVACTPHSVPEAMATAINRRDIAQWASLSANLARLRSRGLRAKRLHAVVACSLGAELLEWPLRWQPLRWIFECVLAVLAMESEPVDSLRREPGPLCRNACRMRIALWASEVRLLEKNIQTKLYHPDLLKRKVLRRAHREPFSLPTKTCR